jgi:hypothetical protein
VSVETPSTIYLLGPSDAKSTDTIARPTGFYAGLVELVLPAAAIAQAAQADKHHRGHYPARDA